MAERIPAAVSKLIVFRAFLSSDGKTPATGKTIAITISLNGAAFGNPNAGATNATEISSGFYKFTLNTTDTGTLGPLAWRGAEATINDAGDVLSVEKATNAGFSALPDTPCATNGSLLTGPGTGTSQVQLSSGQVILQAGSGAGQLDFTSGVVKANLAQILGTALTETAGQIAAAFKKFFNIATPASTMDALTLVATATNLTNAGPDTSGTTTLLGRLTSARAGYLDNLNVGGAVASHADVVAVNQSASKHLLLVTVGQYAPGEAYTIECRTFSAADGSAVNADSTPTLTATGAVSGSLAANLSVVSSPATGVYRATYTVPGSPTLEQIRFDVSAAISAATFTLSCYAQTVDEPTVVWTATDQTHLTAIYNKLPAANIADETLVLAAIGTPMQTGDATLAEVGADVDELITSVAAIPTSNPSAATIAALIVTGGPIAVSGSKVGVSGYASGQDPATLVLDVAASGHNTAGTIGHAINSSGGSSDPLNNAVPGSYPAGTAGYILGGLNGLDVNVISPLSTTGSLSIVGGDDYKATDGRALQFVNAAGTWPNLTSAAVYFGFAKLGKNLCLPAAQWPITGTVVTPTGANQEVQVELTAAQTAGMRGTLGNLEGYYLVVAVLSNGDVITLQYGSLETTP